MGHGCVYVGLLVNMDEDINVAIYMYMYSHCEYMGLLGSGDDDMDVNMWDYW